MTIGRSEKADVPLDDPGVWPAHCQIAWRPEGLVLEVVPSAITSVNGVTVPRAVLRNGDTITLGAVNLRFGFSPVRQRSPTFIEWLTWIALGLLCLGQVAAIYWLAP